jgi:putative ABC transport system substrate-binding protein
MSRLSRRRFVVGAGSAALLVGCGRLPWQAEQPPRVHRVRVLFDGSPELQPRFLVFLQRLHDHGYIEGQNLIMEYGSAEYDYSRLPILAAELARLPVDVILAFGTAASFAAAGATSAVPIVTVVGDPVRAGLADSYARPGRNVTGVTVLNATLTTKRLELLKQTVPHAGHIAVLWNGENNSSVYEFRETQTAAQLLGVELMSLQVRRPEDFEVAFEAGQRQGANALVVIADALTMTNSAPIAALAARTNLPGMYGHKEPVLAGGLMSYGPSLVDNYRRGADYVDRILKGTKPADLPIEQPMTFELVVNMKTARELGITFPHEVALQITEVIE